VLSQQLVQEWHYSQVHSLCRILSQHLSHLCWCHCCCVLLCCTVLCCAVQGVPYLDSDDSFYDDFDDEDDDDWLDILDSDDLPYWDSSSSKGAAGSSDPAAAGAAAIRRQMHDPAFQAWLQQQEQQRSQKEAKAKREAELRSKLQAGVPAAERLRQKQAAAELAKLQRQLQQQPWAAVQRPLMRPGAPSGSSSGGAGGGWGDEDDVILDPNDVRRSDVGLTPVQMAALLEEMEITGGSSSSSRRKGLQAPVFTPRPGYSYSGEARTLSSRLADAGAAGQLQKPLLVRPAVRPTGTGGCCVSLASCRRSCCQAVDSNSCAMYLTLLFSSSATVVCVRMWSSSTMHKVRKVRLYHHNDAATGTIPACASNSPASCTCCSRCC
jgi:hypothetical protein